MFNAVRLQLTGVFLGTAVALLVLLGAGMYWLVANYFRTTTDTALQLKMAYEFQQLAAPLPPTLAVAGRALEQQTLGFSSPGGIASSELAAIYALPLDSTGTILFNPNTFAVSVPPDQAAVQAALSTGYDRRTLALSDGTRVRVLTYRVTRTDGPALLQVGRSLSGQDEALQRLLLGLAALGCGSVAVFGWTSWWLAGRSLRPAQAAWHRQQAFIANASHELRAPLTLLRASAEVAQRSASATEPQHELLADVLHEADHMTRLIEDLLLLSRLDARQLPLKREAVHISELFHDLVRQFERVAIANGITFVTEPMDCFVWVDRTYLWQVLLIVVDNALRHTPLGGRIHLSSDVHAQTVQLVIADTGTGIQPEHLPHLFERFYRVDSSRTDERRGSGLGLAIAQALVELLGGHISITSTLNEGTTVSLRLPAGADS